MTRIPVRFKDSLSLSADMKDFIRKCLEVDEKKRMSLDDLRDWISNGEDIKKSTNELGVFRARK